MRIEFGRARLTLFSGHSFNLEGVLQLREPGVYFVTGANGAGKTLLLHALARLIGKDQAGPIESLEISKVRVEGDATHHPIVGRVRQDPRDNFISRCSSDEIILPLLHPELTREAISDRIDAVLAACDITDESLLRRSVDALSSGQQQLLACCVAFAPKPHLLLLDEPLARLDSDASSRIARLIDAAAKNSIVVLATHHTVANLHAFGAPPKRCYRVSREGGTISFSEDTANPIAYTHEFTAKVLQPFRQSLSSHSENAFGFPQLRRLHATSGTGAVAVKAERLELRIEQRMVARLLNTQFTTGINLVEGGNGSGKTFLGQILGGMIPINPLIRWSKRYAIGSVQLPLHEGSSLTSIRRRGMSVFLPASPDLWLPDRSVEEELREFHPNGLDGLETELLTQASVDGSRRLSQLSYGQKRLVALIALPRRLELLFLDEPFADMSVESAVGVLQLVTHRAAVSDWQTIVLSLTHAATNQPVEAHAS